MKATHYRLGEYKIIESDTGGLKWEAHFGLGALQEGRCFTKGTILFMGPPENDRPGFLIGEFLDQLKPFPEWQKSKYYCRGLEVYQCKTGKRVTKKEMHLWMLDRGADKGGRSFSEKSGESSNNVSSRTETGEVAFRLQKYEIIQKTNDQVVWKTYSGANIVNSGTCIVLEDILFIGSRQTEKSNLTKQQFLANLQQLPEWVQTRYFCNRLTLHDRKTGNRVQEVEEEKQRWSSERTAIETHAAGNGCNFSTESEILHGKPRQIFSRKISAALQSPSNPGASRRGSARFFRFNFKKPDISKGIAIFRTLGIKKWLTFSAVLILLAILSFLFFAFSHWEGHFEKYPFKKKEHSSGHRRDH